MDPLSITASVVTVIQAAEAVISVCCNYRSSIKGSSWEVSRVLEEIRGLRDVLRILEGLADKADTSGSTDQSHFLALKSLCDPGTGILSRCRNELEMLESSLAPPGRSGSAGPKRKAWVEALRWPLQRGDTEKVLERIERFKSTINLTITADLTTSIRATGAATQDIKASLVSIKHDTQERNVCEWLHAMDPYPKYLKTLQDRQTGTGDWFPNDSAFASWKRDPNSILWLYGIPGCGKTVLCSTAIEDALNQRSYATEQAVGVGFYYFDFNDQDQQRCDTMLRSLIAQLSRQTHDEDSPLNRLYSSCGTGVSQPSLPMLMKPLRELVKSFGDVFIILDALDECKERNNLMANVEDMAGWKLASLHMLVTSRKEKEIEESLSELLKDEHRMCIQSARNEGDIRTYVRSRIQTDRRLRRWQKPDVQTEIGTVLVEKAGGMFQWAKCQLDALGRCLSLSDLRKALRSLPKDLDDTYARILQTIEDDGNGDRVAKLMQWLAYSARPMPITEIAEVLTVDAEDDPLVDVERRFEDPYDLLTICSSLVTTVRQQVRRLFQSPSEDEEVLQFAHFSVREYLESSRIHNGPAGKFAIQGRRAHTLIAESCIMYFLQFDLLQTDFESYSVSRIIEEYPLAKYAARYWYIHAEGAEESESIVPLCKALLTSEGYALSICMSLGDRTSHVCIDAQGKCMPVQYALTLNLPKVTGSLISEGADVNSPSKNGWTPLMATSAIRHTPIELIYVLLDRGAEVNAQGEHCCTALMLASSVGNVQAVGTLLDNGADMDAHDSSDHTALTRASLCGNAKIVQKLLERGASISSLGSVLALRWAVVVGDYRMSRMLLEGGVRANVYGPLVPSYDMRSTIWSFNNHLLHALDRDKNDIADLLLAYGADVNARSTSKGISGVALEQALNCGEDNMVNYLLDHGADPSLVRPENLGQSGMKRFEEMLLKIQSQRQLLGVQEEEPQESETDVYE